ncbi:hypothetical protein SEVIR_5G440000v4 [Setaria viridis]|uniref:Secreted protein n=1 Tax=Setaria viridis TaxID=4556 RepID=A0A4U6UQE4_SETVI|nr:hypothetical protein SEVIR_5G440000v2 [Setaria viridis]TKW18568.1 hypothetical protein SEVIR_5G440000v2 [Setaria viridis]
MFLASAVSVLRQLGAVQAAVLAVTTAATLPGRDGRFLRCSQQLAAALLSLLVVGCADVSVDGMDGGEWISMGGAGGPAPGQTQTDRLEVDEGIHPPLLQLCVCFSDARIRDDDP